MQESSTSSPSNTLPPAVPFGALDHFVGFDWAADHHDVAVVDRSGKIVLQLRLRPKSRRLDDAAAKVVEPGQGRRGD